MTVYCENCGHKTNDTVKFCHHCGESIIPLTEDGILKEGVMLDKRYEIVRMIKAGGMGSVYEALDHRFDRTRCAVKEMLNLSTQSEEQEYFIERFKKEAEILHDLKHESLPSVKNYFIENERYYLVMEYIEGEDLENVMSGYGGRGVPENIVIEWSKEILQALEYLHDQSPPIIYRDMKPANIMLRSSDKKIILIDFGIARTVNPKSHTVKTVIGTPAFSPAEIFQGRPEPRSDIYSLGATIHCLVTGIVPVTPFNFQPVRELKPEVSEGLESIVMKALESKVEDRFSTAAEMRKVLENLSDSPSALPDLPSSSQTLPQEISSSRSNFHLESSELPVEPLVKTVRSQTHLARTVPPREIRQAAPSVSPQKPYKNSRKILIPCIFVGIVFILLIILYKGNTGNNSFINRIEKMEKEGKYDEAIELIEKELEVDDNNVFLWRKNGILLYKKGKNEEALKCLERALEIEPSRTEWNIKGLIYYKKKEYEEAVNCYDKALDIDENDGIIWANRGCSLYELGRYEDAYDSFSRSLELNPGDKDVKDWQEKASARKEK